MRILITGASGNIATIMVENLYELDLILWSRRSSSFDGVFKSSISHNLCDSEWWSTASIPEGVDIVIHLAEVVKEKLDPVSINKVISSHAAFLRNAAEHAKVVIYPDTAYKYDAVLSEGAKSYLFIKQSVLKLTCDLPNLMTPVIHPVIDMSGALSKLIALQSRVPLINIFCDFNAILPFLTKSDLLKYFRQLIFDISPPKYDWYSRSEKISYLMSIDGRLNLFYLSKIIKFILRFFVFLPPVALLLSGRNISNVPEREDLFL